MPMIWDTCNVSARDGFAYWRDSVTQAFLPLEPEAASRAAFHGRIVRNGGERLKVSRVVSAGSLVFRTGPGIAKRQNGSFFANLVLSGEAGVKQGGRSGRVHAGEVMVVDTNQPFELSFEMGVDVICIAFDGTSLRRLEERSGRTARSSSARRARVHSWSAISPAWPQTRPGASDCRTGGRAVSGIDGASLPACLPSHALQVWRRWPRGSTSWSMPRSTIRTSAQSGSLLSSALRAP